MRVRVMWIVLAVVGWGGRAPTPTLPRPAPAVIPADDLAAAKSDAPHSDGDDARLAAKDPRIVDLDIIRIRITSKGVGGDGEVTTVASTDLFRRANEAAKAGQTKDAIARYRNLVEEFPDSLYAPTALFNIAAIYDGQADLPATITTLRELVTGYPNARESIEGHLYIAAVQADHQQWAEASATLDAVLARANLTYADRIEAPATAAGPAMRPGRSTDPWCGSTS